MAPRPPSLNAARTVSYGARSWASRNVCMYSITAQSKNRNAASVLAPLFELHVLEAAGSLRYLCHGDRYAWLPSVELIHRMPRFADEYLGQVFLD